VTKPDAVGADPRAPEVEKAAAGPRTAAGVDGVERTAPEPSPAPATAVAGLLETARSRLAQNRLLAPDEDNALTYLERATAIDSADPRVLEVRSELALAIADRARIVLESGNLDGAESLVDRAFGLGADAEVLTQLDLDLAAARTEQRQAETLALGLQRLRDGRLLSPEGDSALSYLAQLRAENPEHPGLVAPWYRLVEGLTERARAAIGRADWADAATFIDALETAGVDGSRLRGDLDFEQRQAEYLRTPASAGEMRLVATGTVNYPEAAARRNVEGAVELEFVIGTDGVPMGAHVVGAEPEGWFEDAALDAIAQYRYAPFERDGRIYRRLARVRIRFGLK
jgi:protein TonB